MKRKIFLSFVSFFLFAGVAVAQATPTVSEFTRGAQMMGSGQPFSLTWQIQNGSGHSLTLDCVSGVRFKYAVGGSEIPCGSAFSTSSEASDAIDLVIENTSGVTRVLTATLSPKDSNGSIISDQKKSVSWYISTANNPIEEFTVSTTSTISYTPITLSWKSTILKGVNLSMECNDNAIATSTSYTTSVNIPCGGMIFSPDLSPSGSLTINPLVSGTNATTLKFTLYPQAYEGSYDGVRALSQYVTVKPPTVVVPGISSVKSDKQNTLSGATSTVYWSSFNTAGVNVKTSCNSEIEVYAGTSTSPSKCDTFFYSEVLPATGTTTMRFVNKSFVSQPIRVYIVPQAANGTFDGFKAISVDFTVLSKQNQSNTLTPPSVNPTNSSSTSTNTTVKNRYTFTTTLTKGASGAAVTALQEYLKTDKTIYPEGMVTGYFGPATEAAVKRFQAKYGIVSSGSPSTTGYGAVGPKTRVKLNSL